MSLERKIDRYLRREDTLLAKGVRKISSQNGLCYRNSATKEQVEIGIAVPLAVASLPIIAGFATAVKLQDGGDCFYSQERVGKDGEKLKVTKIRSMIMGAEDNIEQNKINVERAGIPSDPRSTAIGRFMRPYGIDELPQLWQVLNGEMSLVGCRANSTLVFDEMAKQRPRTHQRWNDVYVSAKPAIINMYRAFKPAISNFHSRYHLDTFYGRKASLGFDFYLMYRTVVGMLIK